MIIIRPDIIEHLIKISAAYFPQEICGVFTGRYKEDRYIINNFHWMPNITKAATKWDYLMDPQTYFDVFIGTINTPVDLVGMFHSHPRGRPIPSIIDIDEACVSGENVPYLIYSPYAGFRAWMLKEDPIKEIEVKIDDKDPYSGIRRNRILADRPNRLACETEATD